MSKRNVKLTLSYDGTDFYGWQTQPNRRTVQQTLEHAIGALIGDPSVRVNASGRTDTGVHAVGQAVNFFTEAIYPPSVILRAVNARLPEDVVVREAKEVDLSFDANRSARRKLYRYVIHDGPVPDLFLRKYSYHFSSKLDNSAMARAAEVLKGEHDFRCFESEWPNRASSVRTVTHLSLNRVGDWIWLDIEANGFLYNMVRSIVGTLINVGRGFWPEEKVAEILSAQDRNQSGPTAPAQGLFLMRVSYE